MKTRYELMQEFDERESRDQRPVGRIIRSEFWAEWPRCPECGLVNKDYDLGRLCVPCWERSREGQDIDGAMQRRELEEEAR